MESDQYHHATQLGEKYEDFHVLVLLCERLGDKAKLQEYMTKFAAQGFSDFLFKQYLDKGKLKKLLSFSEDFPRELSAFLSPHDSLSWLHHTATKEYGKVLWSLSPVCYILWDHELCWLWFCCDSLFQAHEALERMAGNEMQYVAKKKVCYNKFSALKGTI